METRKEKDLYQCSENYSDNRRGIRLRLESFFTVSEQLQLFSLSCLLGIPVGLFYDIFRIIRIILPHNSLATALEDVLFFAVYAIFIMSFTFAAARAEFRMYFIFGNIIGFLFYYFTAGKIITGISLRLSIAIKKFIRRIHTDLNKKWHFL